MKNPLTHLSRRQEILVDFVLVFLFAAVLIKPFFKAKYFDKWQSIESTFISDSRFLQQHWPHPQWQPLWYAGTRFDYVYPPMLRYGSAVVSKVTGYIPVKGYHVYVAFFYCIGIAGVYLLIRAGMKARAPAFLGAAAAALMSPSLLFLKSFRNDAWHLLPVRLGVLVKYGEGPHMTALAFIPIALAFAWVAFERRRLWAIGAAAVACAAVASNNFYGATALAVFYPILVWSFWITRQDKRIFIPAAAIPILTYGLTAFWLVPSYFRLTVENMKYVSEHGTVGSIWVAMGVAVAFAAATDKFARNRPERTWPVFAIGSVVFFTLNVLGNAFFNFRISGEPLRLVPELDLVFILGMLTLGWWLWNKPARPARIVAAVIAVAAFATTLGYVRYAWHMFPLSEYQDRVEYKITSWIAQNLPNSRAYPSGSVRFWFDAWHDLAQVGGGSEQGLLNSRVEPAQWEINLGPKPEPSVLWLQAMGADSVYVADKRSQEMFKDFEHPTKFAGVLPVLYDDQAGNVIYGVPRRYKTLARVVLTDRLNAVQPPRFNDDVENLRAYVAAIEQGPDSPVTLTRQSTDAMTVTAKVEQGQSVLVQETFDPAWQATSNGQSLRIHKDAMDMMVIEAPPGQNEIHLEFVTPLENKIGGLAFLLSALAVLALVALDLKGARKP